MFGWSENREDEKQGEKNRVENGIFHCLIEERKQKRQRIRGKFFTPDPPFFILPIWEENEERKVLKDALYTNTLNLSCVFFLSSLFRRQQRCPTFFFLFLGNSVASNVAPLFFSFLFFWVITLLVVTSFFSWALTLPIFSSFFIIFFIFQGLDVIVYFYFY